MVKTNFDRLVKKVLKENFISDIAKAAGTAQTVVQSFNKGLDGHLQKIDDGDGKSISQDNPPRNGDVVYGKIYISDSFNGNRFTHNGKIVAIKAVSLSGFVNDHEQFYIKTDLYSWVDDSSANGVVIPTSLYETIKNKVKLKDTYGRILVGKSIKYSVDGSWKKQK
jgi:hypothetical protein